MLRIDKTAFISYRRTNKYTALLLFKELTSRGYDVFFDYESIKAGDFGRIILSEVDARGHFIILLTPSALERCTDPNDWVRREIEHALKHKRNIIPLTFEDFDFDDIDKYLPDELKHLKDYNSVSVPVDYFDAAMDKLCSFLDIPIDAVLHPTPAENQAEVHQAIQKAKAEPEPTQAQLTAEEYFERAFSRDENDYDGKISDYSEAIRLKPDYADAYLNRGVTYGEVGRYNKAIEDFDDTIQLDPYDARGYNNRGNVYHLMQEYDKAIEDFDKAIQLNVNFAEAYNNRGTTYSLIRAYNKAIEDFNKAIQLNSNYAAAYYNLGNAYNFTKEYERAIEDYNQTIQLNPEHVAAYNNRGVSYGRRGKYERAIEDYNQAIQLNPKFVGAYISRSWSYYKLGLYELALIDCLKVIDNLQSDSTIAYNNKGFIHYKQKNYQQAIEAFNQALMYNPEQAVAYAHLNRGITYQIEGNLQQANRYYQQYIDADGTDADEVQIWIDDNNRKR